MTDINRENNKRIAKNTLLLYFRMIFTMLVSLFTSRVILATLGIEDYGVNNVVAGFVTMFSFFSGSLGAAISRFLTYELGCGDIEKLKKIFSTCVNVQLLMSFFVVILAETIGVWFLNTQLNVPETRMIAANWVFQFAIIGFVFNLVSIPYNASIIAHECMNVFAYISILEVMLKLAIAYMLYISPFDKLITYSILLAVVGLIIRIVYGIYCKRHFVECYYHMVLDKRMLKEISSFAGWNLMGTGAYLFNTQGVNIITNIFFGVTINAARGIATQVEGVVKQFVNSFTTALNPQITKSYAAGNKDYMFKLVCRGAKYSYLLMLFFVIPFMFEAETILKLWLKEVPSYTSLFLRLTLIGAMFDLLGNSTANACWATGQVKRYYLWVGTIGACVFFISWGLFACGFPAYTAYLTFISVYIVIIFVKLYIIKDLLGLPIQMYYQEVFVRIILVTITAFIIPSILYLIIETSIFRLFLISVVSVLSTLVCILLFGLERSERAIVVDKIQLLIKKMHK